MPPPPELSIVIPAFNEVERLGLTLRRVVAYCEAVGRSHEVLVVDDGSADGTVALARRVAAEHAVVQVIELGRTRGKGAAVRAGVLAARGRRILFSDADLATPIEELAKLGRDARRPWKWPRIISHRRADTSSAAMTLKPVSPAAPRRGGASRGGGLSAISR
jgi:glycosyltransferase involved in cell wall biosynthesis